MSHNIAPISSSPQDCPLPFLSHSHSLYQINHLFIMRFSTLVAFTLPFSVLAAPSLLKRQSALDVARQQVVDGLTNAGIALDTTLVQATAIDQQAVIDDAINAQADIALASAAVERIGAAIVAGVAPEEAECVNTPQWHRCVSDQSK
jgi:hypothetical protein